MNFRTTLTILAMGAYSLLGSPTKAGNVVINELVADPQMDYNNDSIINRFDEWLELYNNSNKPIDLTGWTIEDNSGSTYGSGFGDTTLDGLTILASDFLILERRTDFNFGLNDSGDVIILKNGINEVDRVTYGSFDDGNILDNAPYDNAEDIFNEAIFRFPNGTDTNNDFQDFRQGLATQGTANIPEPATGVLLGAASLFAFRRKYSH